MLWINIHPVSLIPQSQRNEDVRADEEVAAYDESFKAAEVRFRGVGTSIDYLTAKDRLDRANLNLVNAKYDFVLRKKILDYYRGKTQ